MQSRGPYLKKVNSLRLRNSLLAIKSANGNWKEFANEHGIKVATARG